MSSPQSTPASGGAVASPADTSQPGPSSAVLELSRAECLALLGAHSFGRVVVGAMNGPPVIRPVNYTFDRRAQAVVFRTSAGSKFHALLRSSSAAFEIDGVDEGTGTGWSVILHGVTGEVVDPIQLRRLERLGVESWASGPEPHWMQIRAWTVSGRRVARSERCSTNQNGR